MGGNRKRELITSPIQSIRKGTYDNKQDLELPKEI